KDGRLEPPNRPLISFRQSLDMDGLTVRIESPVNPHFLAFVRLHQILAINVISGSAGVLQDIFVAGLGNGACESLSLSLSLRRLTLSIRRSLWLLRRRRCL